MTMAKATTNGIVPFGVVACKEEIYDAVMDNSPKGAIELFHGYTSVSYTHLRAHET